MRRVFVITAAASIIISACAGAPTTTGEPPAGNTATPRGPDIPLVTPPAAAVSPSAPNADLAASLPPGEIEFRVVNLFAEDQPVDVYVRTQGLVQAALVESGLAYAEVTDLFAPPDPGTVVITPVGAGDPTCVGPCDHFISSISTNSGEGNRRTVIVHPEGSTELWHEPEADSVGSTSNALPPADPSGAMLLTVPVALQNADFGFRLAFAGEDGCQTNAVAENILVGGNQIGVFPFDAGPVTATLHENGDGECTDEPVGGPFELTGEAGSRTLLVLYGEPGAMEALVLDV